MTSHEVAAASLLAPVLDTSALRSRHDALRRPYELTDNEFLERQRLVESSARSYPRRLPIALARARGIYVEDVAGRIYIDCLSAAGTLVLGHNHPVARQAIERALRDELPLQTLDLTTPVKDRFIQDVFSLLPGELAARAKIQFCGPAGTDGVEAALKLVKTATGRSTMLSFHGGYHGMSHGALSLMGNLGPKRDVAGLMPDVQFLPYPYAYRCPFGLGGEAGENAGLRYIETVLGDPESGVRPAAGMVLEAVQGEGGVVPASDHWPARDPPDHPGRRRAADPRRGPDRARPHRPVLRVRARRHHPRRDRAVQGVRRRPAARGGDLRRVARSLEAGCPRRDVSRQPARDGGRLGDHPVRPQRAPRAARRGDGPAAARPPARAPAPAPLHRRCPRPRPHARHGDHRSGGGRAAFTGGETPIVDCRRVYRALPVALRTAFAERGRCSRCSPPTSCRAACGSAMAARSPTRWSPRCCG